MNKIWKKTYTLITVILVFITFACTSEDKTPKPTNTEVLPATSTPDDSIDITPTDEPTVEVTETLEPSQDVKAEASRDSVFTISIEGI